MILPPTSRCHQHDFEFLSPTLMLSSKYFLVMDSQSLSAFLSVVLLPVVYLLPWYRGRSCDKPHPKTKYGAGQEK